VIKILEEIENQPKTHFLNRKEKNDSEKCIVCLAPKNKKKDSNHSQCLQMIEKIINSNIN
jgi:hypothetical protein